MPNLKKNQVTQVCNTFVWAYIATDLIWKNCYACICLTITRITSNHVIRWKNRIFLSSIQVTNISTFSIFRNCDVSRKGQLKKIMPSQRHQVFFFFCVSAAHCEFCDHQRLFKCGRIAMQFVIGTERSNWNFQQALPLYAWSKNEERKRAAQGEKERTSKVKYI